MGYRVEPMEAKRWRPTFKGRGWIGIPLVWFMHQILDAANAGLLLSGTGIVLEEPAVNSDLRLQFAR